MNPAEQRRYARPRNVRIAVIEDDAEDRLLIRERLNGDRSIRFELADCPTLESGFESLQRERADLVLLDLNLPDSKGLDTFLRLRAEFPALPVIILTGFNDETFALEALRQGAQDYLVKGTEETAKLARAVNYAIERNRTELELRNLLLIDELTALYNRRGFEMFGEQYLKLARRNGERFLLFLAEVGNLRGVRDTYGSHEADLATLRAAKTLRDTFRKSDLIGYLEGDRFAAVLPEVAPEGYPAVRARLLARVRAADSTRYRLALRCGSAAYDPETGEADIGSLVNAAAASLV